jgi:hypothetical protein
MANNENEKTPPTFQTIEEEANLPSNFVAVDSLPVIPGRQNGGPVGAPPVASTGIDNFQSGQLPPFLGLPTDLVRAGTPGPGVPSTRLMPIAATGSSQNVAAIKSAVVAAVKDIQTTINEDGDIIALETNGIPNGSQASLNLTNGSGVTIANVTGGNVLISATGSLDWISVLAYGADPSGAADSTAAIQSAWAAAVTAKVPLYFPSGTYKVTSTLSFTSNPPAMIGDGSGVSIIRNAGTTALFSLSASAPITIQGIQFAGTGASVSYSAEVTLIGAGRLEDVSLTNSLTTAGIEMFAAFAQQDLWTIDSCNFTACSLSDSPLGCFVTNSMSVAGWSCSSLQQAEFHNCTMGGSGVSSSVGFFFTGCSQIILDGCDILSGTSVTFGGGFTFISSDTVSLRNCESTGGTTAQFVLNVVSRATFENCLATGGTGFLVAGASPESVTFLNCRAEPGSAGSGFVFDASPSSPSTMVCIGCTVGSSVPYTESFANDQTSGGVVLIGCSDDSSAANSTGGQILTLGCAFTNPPGAGVGGVGFAPNGSANVNPNYLSSPTAANSSKLAAQTGTTTGHLVSSSSGVYRISGYLECTTAGSAGTLQTTITWTDDNGSQSATLLATPLGLSTTGFATGELIVKAISGDIDFSTAITSGSGSPAYNAALTAELIG